MASLKQFDPTGLYSQRRAFLRDIARRFVAFNKAIRKLFVEENAFGLTTNARYEFLTDPQKTKAFEDWIKKQVKDGLLISSDPNKPWTAEYIESAYRKAVVDSYTEVNDLGAIPDLGKTRKEFLRDAFSSKTSTRQLKRLYTRSFNGMSGITTRMSKKMTNILAVTLTEGKNPRQIVKQLSEEVGMTRRRAERIARTELIYSYAEGQLDTFEQLNVEELGVMSEWLTAGDGRVCPRCLERAGSRYTIEEARGLIPFHPNCRCAWIPHVPLPGSKSTNRKRLVRPSGDPRPSKRSKVKRGGLSAPAPTLFDQQPTAVIRWMQQDGWTFEEIKSTLSARGVAINDVTIRTQMSRARSGQAGAQLTTEQAAELRGFRLLPPQLITTTTSTTTPRPTSTSTTTTSTTTSTTTPRPIVTTTTTTSTTTPRPRPVVDVKTIPYSKVQWIRVLQQEGYSFQEIKQFMDENGLEVAEATIRKQMGNAKKGIGLVEPPPELRNYLNMRRGIGPPPAPAKVTVVTTTTSSTTTSTTTRPLRSGAGSKPAHITYSGEETDLHRKVWSILKGQRMMEHEQAVEIGELVYQEALKKMDPDLVKAAVRYQETEKETQRLADIMNKAKESYRKLIDSRASTEDLLKQQEIVKKTSQDVANHQEASREVLRAFPAAIRTRYVTELNTNLIEVSKSLRDFGGDNTKKVMSKVSITTKSATKRAQEEKLKRVLEVELDKLPADWLAEIDKYTDKIALDRVARGYYLSGGTTSIINISGSNDADIASTMLHEVGHMVQDRMKTASFKNKGQTPLYMIEKGWRRDRAVSSAEGLVETVIYQGTTEKGYKDEFTNHYIGKTYSEVWASEVLTMGLEGIFHEAHSITAKDPNMVKFMVGLLVGY